MFNRIIEIFQGIYAIVLAIAVVLGILFMVAIGIQTGYYILNDPYYYQQELLACCLGQGVFCMLINTILKDAKYILDEKNS